jgi:predicted Rossmann fold nucleotide-binding protein DprA/Smf involved in DNA uptake
VAWARGIDPASHRGAIAAKGKPAAVLGTGIYVMYPKENTRLAEQIVALGGALISEFPVGTLPAPQNFPIRNGIISGMSAGVLVVEAAEYSSTRIASRCALEQNRDVYAVPGNVTNKNSWGPNTLIKQERSSLPRGKSFRRMYRSRSVPGRMNPTNRKPHLYSRTRWPRPTKKRFSDCSRPMNPRILIRWSNCWKTKCRPRKFLLRSLNWS